MIRILAAAMAILIPTTAAVSATAQAVRTIEEAPTAGSTTVKGDPNRRVCRDSTPTGSRLKKSRVCRTAKEWADLNAATVAQAKQLQRPSGLKSQ